MPKRKEREEEKAPRAWASECVDREALDVLYQLDLPSSLERKVVALSNRWLKERSATVTVRYDESEDGKFLVPRDASAAGLKAWMMRCLFWRSYYRIVIDVAEKPLWSLYMLSQALLKRGWEVGGYRGNSILVEREDKFEGFMTKAEWELGCTFPVEDLQALADCVATETDQKTCALTEKSMFMTQRDYDRLVGPKIYGKVAPKNRIYYVLEMCAFHQKLRRCGLMVMYPHKHIPQVYLPKKEAVDWIRDTLLGHPSLSPYDMKELLHWFEFVDALNFRIVRSSGRYIGFEDCCFDLIDLKPKNYDQVQGEFCTVYFRMTYEAANTAQTPLFDQLISYQLTPGECDLLRVMIGRLQYALNVYDHWQVVLIVWGNGGVGKTTLHDVIKSQFSDDTVGTIGGTQEKGFGLQSLFKKRVILVSDLPENFNSTVCQQDYQRMISGENLSAAVKHKGPINAQWRTPMALFGNRLPAYRDQNNSISRRTFALRFLKKIDPSLKNTGMTQQIIRKESASILLQCVRLYRERAKLYESKDFWYMAGPEFKHMQTETLEQSSAVDVFLSEGDDAVRVVKCEGAYLPWNIFAGEFHMFLQRHYKHESKDIDRVKLEARGFRVREMNMCSNCGKRAIRSECGCGEMMHRKKLLMIQHMSFRYYNGMCWAEKKTDISKHMGRDYSASEMETLFDQTEQQTRKEQQEEIDRHVRSREELQKNLSKVGV